MRQLQTSTLFNAALTLERTAAIARRTPEQVMPDSHAQMTVEMLRTVQEQIQEIGLPVANLQIERVIGRLNHEDGPLWTYGKLGEGLTEIAHRIQDELLAKLVFMVPAERVAYFTNRQPFGAEVATKFSEAVTDLSEGAWCLGLSRYTACVFHLMRVLERGLGALAQDLGYTKLEKNWEIIIQEVEKVVRGLPHSTPEQKGYLEKRSAALSHLRNVKDAWRNSTIHPRPQGYTEEQALDVWTHTGALMRSLAALL
jgi:hypothetical protein